MQQSRKLSVRAAGAVYIILSAVLFGLMPLLAKIAYANGSNAYSAAFGRFFFGSVILLMILLLKPNGSLKVTGRQFLHIARLSIFYALTPVLLYASYDMIGTGLATTLHFTYPIAVIILSAVLFRAKPGAKEILCTVLCASGMLLLYSPGGSISLGGMGIAAASGLAYSLYIVLLGRSDLEAVPVLTMSFWLSLMAALEIGVTALLFGELRFGLTVQGWIAEIILALFATVFGLVLFQRGLFLCDPVQASLLSTFEPLTGVVLGLVVFHETLTGRLCAGMGFILLSTVILVLPHKNRRISHGCN